MCGNGLAIAIASLWDLPERRRIAGRWHVPCAADGNVMNATWKGSRIEYH
ncbi:MAG: hypothetical protein JWP38_2657 [Herbaspirillum sp.]|nr:hypothetical protein [Herbaspirillum sp.]